MSQEQEQETPEIFKGFKSEAYSDGELVSEAAPEDEAVNKHDFPQFLENDEGDDEENDDDLQDLSDDDDGDDDDASEDDEPETDPTDDDEDGKDKKKKPRRKSAGKRISELTARAKAAEERAAELEAKLEKGDDPEPKKEEPKPLEIDTSDLTEPNAADFDFGELDAGYIEQMAEYKAEIAFRKREAKAKADQAEADAEKAKNDAAAQLEKNFLDNVYEPGLEKFDDFEDIVIEGGKAGDYQLSPTLVSLISESEQGAEIMYHFASNPDEAEKVANMSVERQAAYFGRMEARFAPSQEDAGKQRRAKPSSAPKPPRSKSRGKGAGQRTNPATTDFAAFERMVNAKG